MPIRNYLLTLMQYWQTNSHKYCLFTILVSSILAGCSGNYRAVAVVDQEDLNDASKGLLVLKLVNASAWESSFDKIYITSENVNESSLVKHVELSGLPNVRGKTSIFFSALEPGKYIVHSVGLEIGVKQGRSLHDYWSAKGGVELGTFSVVAGKTTDLGNIIYYQVTVGDSYANLLTRTGQDGKGRVLDEYFPDVAYDKSSLLGWNPDGMQKNRRLQYLSVVQNPSNFGEVFKSNNSALYFPGTLGAFIQRSESGKWTLDALNTDLGLRKVIETTDGTIVVLTDEGQLYTRRPNEAWQEIGIERFQHIEDMRLAEDGTVVLAVSENNTLKITKVDLSSVEPNLSTIAHYDSNVGLRGTAEQSREFEKPTKNMPEKNRLSNVSLHSVNGKSVIFLIEQNPKISPKTAIRRSKVIEYDASLSKAATHVGASRLDRMIDAGKIPLGIDVKSSLTGKVTNYFKYNEEESSWKKLETNFDACPTYSDKTYRCSIDGEMVQRYQELKMESNPVFSTVNDAKVFGYIVYGGVTEDDPTVTLFETEDGGKTWKNTGYEQPESLCSNIVDIDGSTIVVNCDGYSSDFYQSSNNGETWEHVFEHKNFL